MTYHDDWLEPPELIEPCEDEDCDWITCPYGRDRTACIKAMAEEAKEEMERES